MTIKWDEVIVKTIEVIYKLAIIILLAIGLRSCSINWIEGDTKDFSYVGTKIDLRAYPDRIIEIKAEKATFSAVSPEAYVFVNENTDEKVVGIFDNAPFGYDSKYYYLAKPQLVSGGVWKLVIKPNISPISVRIESDQSITVVQKMVNYPWDKVISLWVFTVVLWIICSIFVCLWGYI